MNLNPLNFFSPYEKLAAGHENQLTRALLVVLRCSSMAHQLWLGLVAPGKRLYELPKADFAAQRQHVLNAKADLSGGEAITGISVSLAPEFSLGGARRLSSRSVPPQISN